MGSNPPTMNTELEHSTEPMIERGPPGVFEGYELGKVLGVGGMGEVLAASDREIEREVAIKRLKGRATEDAVARFLREAKIQARLDHPAVVPVYQIGRDDHGVPFFTMKRVSGVTLQALLAAGDASLQRLLRVFVDVAQAVEFAHARRIVHRDLKPGNIMLGEYGEVYVLDWGLARSLGEHDSSFDRAAHASQPGVTMDGAVLGTPGYMAPEQLSDASSVGPSADVYALGAILFEILTGDPLHPRGDAIESTLVEQRHAPSSRRQDVPPELDALCTRAVAWQASDRPAARDLADGVQRYLDGDRDLATRQRLARVALDDAGGALAAGRRADAIRDAGRALALDPSSAEAAEQVTRLMLEPPAIPPAELRAELALAEASQVAANARSGVATVLACVAIMGVAIAATEIRDGALIGWIAGLCGVLLVVALSLVRRPADRDRTMWVVVALNAAILALATRATSPLIFAPAAACLVVAGNTLFPALGRRWPVVVAVFVAAWAFPGALELVGATSSTWEIGDGGLVVQPAAFELRDTNYMAVTFVAHALLIATVGIHVGRLARRNLDSEREILSQRWHYQQLVPASVRARN